MISGGALSKPAALAEAAEVAALDAARGARLERDGANAPEQGAPERVGAVGGAPGLERLAEAGRHVAALQLEAAGADDGMGAALGLVVDTQLVKGGVSARRMVTGGSLRAGMTCISQRGRSGTGSSFVKRNGGVNERIRSKAT